VQQIETRVTGQFTELTRTLEQLELKWTAQLRTQSETLQQQIQQQVEASCVNQETAQGSALQLVETRLQQRVQQLVGQLETLRSQGEARDADITARQQELRGTVESVKEGLATERKAVQSLLADHVATLELQMKQLQESMSPDFVKMAAEFVVNSNQVGHLKQSCTVFRRQFRC
jgi:hypothetical protein